MFGLPPRIVALFMLFRPSHGQIFLTGGRGKASLELYNADRTTLIGPLVNNLVIDLAKTPSVNIKASAKCLKKFRVSSMTFALDNKIIGTDNTSPYWMMDGAWTPTVGNHTITIEAYRRNDAKGRLMLKTTTSVMVMDSRTRSPVPAPVTAPLKAPVPVPILSPVATPMVAPVATPMVAPVATPMVAPATDDTGYCADHGPGCCTAHGPGYYADNGSCFSSCHYPNIGCSSSYYGAKDPYHATDSLTDDGSYPLSNQCPY
jgi:hypothetical protein